MRGSKENPSPFPPLDPELVAQLEDISERIESDLDQGVMSASILQQRERIQRNLGLLPPLEEDRPITVFDGVVERDKA